MPDRPPGKLNGGPPEPPFTDSATAKQPMSVLRLPPGEDGGTDPPVPLSAVVTDLLAHSDLMDASLRLRLAAWREGYAAGYDRGAADGRAQAEAADEAWWRDLAPRVAHGGPKHAELDRRRYPPDGRLSWIRDRPGGDAA